MPLESANGKPKRLPTAPPVSVLPLIVADEAEADKLNRYGDVKPHVVLPFAVESSGALGRSAAAFFKRCTKQAGDRLGPAELLRSTWSSASFASYFYQQLSMATLRGKGHFFQQAALVLAGVGVGGG